METDPLASTSALPFLSVVLPVRCEAPGLRLLLPDLIRQSYPPSRWEIIVADGLSTDGTRQFVRQFADTSPVPITLLDNPGIRSSAGRNVGVRTARGELIVFIDGHCRVRSTTFLADTAALFHETGADCLCRPQPLHGVAGSVLSAAIAAVRRSPFGHGRGSMIYDLTFAGFTDPRSSGASYRRLVFETIGLYDERFDACEDVELNVRVALAGMRAYSSPLLAVDYTARKTISGLIRQMMRYGRGRVRLATKHASERSPSSLAPLALLLALLCPIVLLPVHLLSGPLVSLILCAPSVLYVAAVLYATAHLVRAQRDASLVWALVLYPAIHLGLGAGMLAEAASFLGRWRRRRKGAGAAALRTPDSVAVPGAGTRT